MQQITGGMLMYRIGELAKLAGVTPDTIRYYEKQQMMDHSVRTEGGFRLLYRKRFAAASLHPPRNTAGLYARSDP